MKFLLLSQFAGSYNHGMVLRNYALARELVRLGHEVTIVASSYSHTRSVQPANASFFEHEELDGINYYWLPGSAYSVNSSFGRVLSMLLYTAISVLWVMVFARKLKADYIVASSPSPIVIYPAYVAARFCSAKLVFDIRDLWPLTLKRLGGYSASHPFVMFMQCAEDFACRHSELVVAVPQNCERYLKSRGLQDGRFMHLPNGVAETRAGEPLAKELSDKLYEMRASGKFLVGYAGAIGLANSLDCLIRALANVDSKVVCILAGEGECVPELQELSVQLGIAERVIFIGRIRKAEVASLLELVDAGYLGARKSSLYRFGVSVTKLNDYAMAGLPILYGFGDSRNPVFLSGCGLEFQPESHESCAAALERLVDMSPAERKIMGLKGREWVIEHQLWSSQAKTFLRRVGSL